MNPAFLKWVFPIVLEFFKSENRFKIYLKRNLTIAVMFIAMIFALSFCFYFFEQATVYGAAVKDRDAEITTLKDKLVVCSTQRDEKAAALANCG